MSALPFMTSRRWFVVLALGLLTSASACVVDPHPEPEPPTGPAVLGAHLGFTATLLSTGEVLVVGGVRGKEVRDTALRYAPETGRWTSAGSLVTGRHGHTATRLDSGQVLITGGRTQNAASEWSTVLATAELYDPASGTWSATASMTQPRDQHRAVLLRDGRVLVTGGYGDGESHETAEVYEPRTGQWSRVSAMGVRRLNHAATRLPSGRVLVVGGAYGEQRFSAETYDPETDTWAPTGSTASEHPGGRALPLPDGRVLIDRGDVQHFIEFHAPERGTWSALSLDLSVWNCGSFHTVTALPDDRVLFAGGFGDSGGVTGVTLLDLRTSTWTRASPLPEPRVGQESVLLPDGRVLLVGGVRRLTQDPVQAIAPVVIYDPRTDTWK